MAIVFFDLDRTLISRNSATLWIRFELAERRITWRQALRAGTWVLRYSLGAVDLDDPIRRTVAALAGQAEADVAARTARFYAEAVRPLYRPGARAAIDRHRRAGDTLVLLTSSSNYLAEAVCAELGLDDCVCNRFEIDATGRYTGRADEPLCFGPGKVVLAERYVASRGERLAASTFYSDSHSDLPMLQAVGFPVVVDPDPRLRRHARRNGWPIEDWGVPG
ncbi:MAG TPA: HAD family hydrolase [Candidatus Limnocylindria bacterium]|nr:HAD family hydrolase [Candidatus Limnocylindria bacterium]